MFNNTTPIVLNLIIINVLVYFTGEMSYATHNFLSLHYIGSPEFNPVQFFTYMFVHDGWRHIFFNMLGLFFFGPLLERHLGSKRFLTYYVVCGIGAGVLYSGYMYWEAYNLQQAIGPVEIKSTMMGASGALYAVLLGVGYIFPFIEVFLLFPPLPIKMVYLVIFYGVSSIYGMVQNQSGDNIAHFAHLSGMIVGFIMLKIWREKRANYY